MSALEICRICLVSEVKLYRYDSYGLKKFYEQVMASKVNERDGLPRYFCYECATMLHKFHKFKEKCYRGQGVLREIMWKGPITIKSIQHLDRQKKNLKSSLDIITINRRVRTYTVKPKIYKTNEPIVIEADPTSITDDDDYIDDYDDKEELPPLPEVVDVKTIDDDDYDDKEALPSLPVVVDVKTIDNDDYNNIDDYDDKEELPPLPEVVDVKTIDDDDYNNIDDYDDEEELPPLPEVVDVKTIDDDVNKTDSVTEKINDNEETILPTENSTDIEKVFTDNEEKKKNVKKAEENKKPKKFEVTKKTTKLDPKNWLKLNLSEDEAIEEFKARAQHKWFISADYKCNDCLKGFSKEDMLNRHVKLRHSETSGSIDCRFCHMRFQRKGYLTKHMRQHYTKYKCLRCELVCPLETTALFHEEYHNGVTRKCAHCGEEFKHLSTYYTHLRTHRSEHVCTLCGASFVSEVGLRLHKRIKHIDAESEVTQGAQGDDGYCTRCDIRFETKKAYEEHLIHSLKHVDGLENLETQGPIVSIPRKPRRLARLPSDCSICGKHFSTQAAYRRHHLAEHPQSSLVEPRERQICEICGLSLLHLSNMPSHLNTHTKAKLHTCNICGKQFNSKGGMTKHQLIHSSEKPVPCTLCDKRFKQISSMRLHYRTFHLKEPYPKRNRKRKIEVVSKLNDCPEDDSDDNLTLDKIKLR